MSLSARLSSRSARSFLAVRPNAQLMHSSARPLLRSGMHTQLVTPVRSFGGGTMGLQKSIVMFGFLGGVTVFMALASQLLKANTVFAHVAVCSLIGYLYLGESNMSRHQNCGSKAFQDIHIMFTCAFFPMMYVFY